MYGTVGIISLFIRNTCFFSCKQFNTLVYVFNSPDMELTFFHSIDDLSAQHKIDLVLFWYHHTLVSCESPVSAIVKEAFDLFVHTTNGLNVAKLIDRTSNSYILLQRNIRKGRQ